MSSVSDCGMTKYSEIKRYIGKARDEHQLVLFVGDTVEYCMPLWKKTVEKIAQALEIFPVDFDNAIIPQY